MIDFFLNFFEMRFNIELRRAWRNLVRYIHCTYLHTENYFEN